jgi:hypothetical protein
MRLKNAAETPRFLLAGCASRGASELPEPPSRQTRETLKKNLTLAAYFGPP